jgi:hypothetical protein
MYIFTKKSENISCINNNNCEFISLYSLADGASQHSHGQYDAVPPINQKQNDDIIQGSPEDWRLQNSGNLCPKVERSNAG